MPERERYFTMGQATLSGPVAVNENRFVEAARNLAGLEGEKKGRVSLFRARGSVELEKVSATQAFG